MPDCNIRNVGNSLIRAMKIKAAEEGYTLRDWAIRQFTLGVDNGRLGHSPDERDQRGAVPCDAEGMASAAPVVEASAREAAGDTSTMRETVLEPIDDI
jgi:hypothetical protein